MLFLGFSPKTSAGEPKNEWLVRTAAMAALPFAQLRILLQIPEQSDVAVVDTAIQTGDDAGDLVKAISLKRVAMFLADVHRLDVTFVGIYIRSAVHWRWKSGLNSILYCGTERLSRKAHHALFIETIVLPFRRPMLPVTCFLKRQFSPSFRRGLSVERNIVNCVVQQIPLIVMSKTRTLKTRF